MWWTAALVHYLATTYHRCYINSGVPEVESIAILAQTESVQIPIQWYRGVTAIDFRRRAARVRLGGRWSLLTATHSPIIIGIDNDNADSAPGVHFDTRRSLMYVFFNWGVAYVVGMLWQFIYYVHAPCIYVDIHFARRSNLNGVLSAIFNSAVVFYLSLI